MTRKAIRSGRWAGTLGLALLAAAVSIASGTLLLLEFDGSNRLARYAFKPLETSLREMLYSRPPPGTSRQAAAQWIADRERTAP